MISILSYILLIHWFSLVLSFRSFPSKTWNTRSSINFLQIRESYQLLNQINIISKLPFSLTQRCITGLCCQISNHNDIWISEEVNPSVQIILDYMNNATDSSHNKLMRDIALSNEKLLSEYSSANFWSGGNFEIKNVQICKISSTKIYCDVAIMKFSKLDIRRNIEITMPIRMDDENSMKRSFIELISRLKYFKKSVEVANLPFGNFDFSIPTGFRFNDYPHATWLRSYMNELVKNAIINAIYDDAIPDKSRLQIQLNFPELNPAFDTYRIGTMLELVRHSALCLAINEGKKVRILVQQSLGEGVFAGLPLAIASMRVILEKMDFGEVLTKDTREQVIRFGCLGKDQIAPDDDVIFIISPQNIVGASVMELLEETVIAANGRPLLLINPSLGDRPSANNVMQIRGRGTRRELQDSFQDLCVFRLLYPSSGGYMFPIRGLLVKKDWQSNWIVYESNKHSNGQDVYDMIAVLPSHPTPERSFVSQIFLDN